MEGAFEAMGEGTVDVNWAKEHHSLWLAEEKARVGPNRVAAPAACPRRRPNRAAVKRDQSRTPGRHSRAFCYKGPMKAHAHHRSRRLERLGQDHADHQGASRA